MTKPRALVFFFVVFCGGTPAASTLSVAFLPPKRSTVKHDSAVRSKALPSAEESARALTEYMAKAHEEKVRAVAEVEKRFKDRIKELESEVEALKAALTEATLKGVRGDVKRGPNAHELPVADKAMEDKFSDLQNFVSDRVAELNEDRAPAVTDAEKTLKKQYEAKITELSGKIPGDF